MDAEKMRVEAEKIRRARRNPVPLTRERALRMFEQHRRAAQRSRLALRVETPENPRG